MKEKNRQIEYGLVSAMLLAALLGLSALEGKRQQPPTPWTSTPTATPDFTKEPTTTPSAELATSSSVQLFGATEVDTWIPEHRGMTRTPTRTKLSQRTRSK